MGGDEYILAVRSGGGETGEYQLTITSPPPSIAERRSAGTGGHVQCGVYFISNNGHFETFRVQAPLFSTELDLQLQYVTSTHPDYNLDGSIRVTDAAGDHRWRG